MMLQQMIVMSVDSRQIEWRLSQTTTTFDALDVESHVWTLSISLSMKMLNIDATDHFPLVYWQLSFVVVMHYV